MLEQQPHFVCHLFNDKLYLTGNTTICLNLTTTLYWQYILYILTLELDLTALSIDNNITGVSSNHDQGFYYSVKPFEQGSSTVQRKKNRGSASLEQQTKCVFFLSLSVVPFLPLAKATELSSSQFLQGKVKAFEKREIKAQGWL